MELFNSAFFSNFFLTEIQIIRVLYIYNSFIHGRCKDKVKYDKCDKYWSSLYRSRLDNIQYRYGKNITQYGISKI